jgi:hypothetical protein
VRSADRGLPPPRSPLEKLLHEGVHQASDKLQHEFHYNENGHDVYLRYNIEHAPGLVALDEHGPVASITCTPESLRITFTHEPSLHNTSLFRVGALLVGGVGWGCTEFDDQYNGHVPRAIMRSIDSIAIDGGALLLSTSQLTPHQFFKNADIEARTSHYPHTLKRGSQPSEEVEAEIRDRRLRRAHQESEVKIEHSRRLSEYDFDSFPSPLSHETRRRRLLSCFWHPIECEEEARRKAEEFLKWAAHKAWEIAKHAAEEAAAAIKEKCEESPTCRFALEGAADVTMDHVLASVEMPKAEREVKTASSFGPKLSCTATASATITARFILKVRDYKLQKIEMLMIGDAKFDVEAGLEFTQHDAGPGAGDSVQPPGKDPIYTADIASWNFMTGPIPWHLALSMPVYDGFTISVNGGSKASAGIKAEGKVQMGVSIDCTDSGCAPNWINEHSFTHSGGIHEGTAANSAVVQIYIEPMLSLKIDAIGGPYAALRPAVALSATMGGDGCDGLTWGLDATLSIGFGAIVDVKLGGHDLFNREWDGKFITLLSVPITKGCVGFPHRGIEPLAPSTPAFTPFPTVTPTPAPTTPAPTPTPPPTPVYQMTLSVSGSHFSQCFPAVYTATSLTSYGQTVYQSDSTASQCNYVAFLAYCNDGGRDSWVLNQESTPGSSCSAYLLSPQYIKPTATWIFAGTSTQTWGADTLTVTVDSHGTPPPTPPTPRPTPKSDGPCLRACQRCNANGDDDDAIGGSIW